MDRGIIPENLNYFLGFFVKLIFKVGQVENFELLTSNISKISPKNIANPFSFGDFGYYPKILFRVTDSSL